MTSLLARRHHPALVAVLVAATVTGATLVVRRAGGLQRLELMAHDHFTHLTADGPAVAPRVALLEVTERDIQTIGSWPVPDATLASIIDALESAGSRAIALDIYRDIPVPPGSDWLETTLLASPHVVVPSKYPDAGERGVGPPPILDGTEKVGFNNVVVDADGTVRRGLLFMDDERGGVGFAIALQSALLYLAENGIYAEADPEHPEQLQLGATTFEPLSSDFGGYARIDAGGYQYLLDFRAAPSDFESITLTDLFEDPEARRVFHDRIALIGVTAESLRDTFHIARQAEGDGDGVQVVPGVILHAQMASQILRYALGESAPIRALPGWQEALGTALCASLGVITGLRVRSLRLLALSFGLVFGGLWLAGRGALLAGLWLPVVPASITWTTSVAGMVAYSSRRERRERAELMHLFSRHVTKQVAEEVWRHRDEFLEGGRPRRERLTATTLFIDMKGYTSRAESMDPGKLMDWIDEFLSEMAQIVLNRGGLVEDYFGDGMMACFGIPIRRTTREEIVEDARRAVGAALEMEGALRALNERWKSTDRPTAKIRVGISTGPIVAGSLGSADRLKYSVVGDAVVTAQRLESMEEESTDFDASPARILINQGTRDCLGADVRVEHFGEFKLKGKTEPVSVYRVMDRIADGCDPV